MCAFVWLPEYISVFSEIKVFKCFLCTCAANDAGHKATGGPPQELDAKRLVLVIFRTIVMYILYLPYLAALPF